jgi:hypothetical protein
MTTELDISTAKILFESIDATSLMNLKNCLYTAAIRYANLRAEWQLLAINERLELDDSRTQAHNVFIDSCNILSRNMVKRGEKVQWREELGNERKYIGDFACFIQLFLGLKAR